MLHYQTNKLPRSIAGIQMSLSNQIAMQDKKKMPLLQAMVQRNREKQQKQLHINGTENILLKGCTTEHVQNYNWKLSRMFDIDTT